jgi:hypothetical protein
MLGGTVTLDNLIDHFAVVKDVKFLIIGGVLKNVLAFLHYEVGGRKEHGCQGNDKRDSYDCTRKKNN